MAEESKAEEDVRKKAAEILASDLNEGDKIRQLHALGFSRRSLARDLGFAPATIYLSMPADPDMKKAEEPANLRDSLPAVRKMGSGVEVLTPEVLLRSYMDGGDHDEWELRGMMKLRAAMLMVMDLVNIRKGMAEADAKELEPLLKILSVSREELDAAAARARGSNMEIAQAAASGAVGRVIGYLDEKIPKGPPPKNENEFIAKRMDRIFEMMDHMMEQKMFPNSQGKPPEGWEYEDRSQPATGPGPQDQAPAPARGTAPGWTTENVKEESHVQPVDVRSQPAADGAGEGGGQAPENGNPQIPQGGEG